MLKKLSLTLVSYELWIVAASIAVGLILPAFLPLGIIIALLFWPLRWIANGTPGVRSVIDIPVLVLLLLLPVTLWATPRLEHTLTQVYRLAAGICLFYAVVNWGRTRARLRIVLSGVFIMLFGLILVAPVGIEWGVSKYELIPADFYQRLPLLLADPANPNVMAGYLALLLPVAIAVLGISWRALSPLVRVLLGMLIPLGIAVLLLTQSRGGWLALILSLCVLVAITWRWGWLFPTAAVILLAAGFSIIGPDTAADVLLGGGQLQNIGGRLEVWSRALYMIEDFSITGVGMGMYMDVADLLYPFFLFPAQHMEHAHNLFLQVAVDLGIPGLIAWLAVLLAISYAAWRIFQFGRTHDDVWFKGVGAGLLCSQVALVVHGSVDAVTWGMVRPSPLVWGIWAIAALGVSLLEVPVGSDCAESS